jgi:hypothetical protein
MYLISAPFAVPEMKRCLLKEEEQQCHEAFFHRGTKQSTKEVK